MPDKESSGDLFYNNMNVSKTTKLYTENWLNSMLRSFYHNRNKLKKKERERKKEWAHTFHFAKRCVYGNNNPHTILDNVMANLKNLKEPKIHTKHSTSYLSFILPFLPYYKRNAQILKWEKSSLHTMSELTLKLLENQTRMISYPPHSLLVHKTKITRDPPTLGQNEKANVLSWRSWATEGSPSSM